MKSGSISHLSRSFRMRKDKLLKINILDFIRGEKQWSELPETGIDISFKNDLLQIKRKTITSLDIHPGITDIAEGLLTYKTNPEKLKEWSAIILGLPFINLEKIEKHTKGDELKEILWDLSFGTKIDQQMIGFVESLQKH